MMLTTAEIKNKHRLPEHTTVTEVARVFEIDPRTVKKRLDNFEPSFVDGNQKLYAIKDVISKALLGQIEATEQTQSLNQEKARYYQALTEKVRVEIDRLTDKYMLADEVEASAKRQLLQFRERLLNVKNKLARPLARESDPDKVAKILDEAMYDALNELASYGRSPANKT